MTPTLVSSAAAPVPAPRAGLLFTAHPGTQRPPMTEVRHTRQNRRVEVVAVTAGLVSVTIATVAIMLASAW